MKKSKTLTIGLLTTLIVLSSCIGSFPLTQKLRDWNHTVGDKMANEIVFFSLHIMPVYEVSYLADVLIFNSIEFWSGKNPLAQINTTRKIKGEKDFFFITNLENGYLIEDENREKKMQLTFDEASKTWFVSSNTCSKKEVLTFNENGTAKLYLPNDEFIIITLDKQGLLMAQEATRKSFNYKLN